MTPDRRPGDPRETRLEVGRGICARLSAEAPPPGGRFLVTDANVLPLLPPPLAALPRHVLAPGEPSKSWATLGALLEDLVHAHVDGDGEIIAAGGGVVTDLGTLAAALHRRGIAWTAVPTTLVGQVDAALGGKGAVNLGGAKNAAGAFHGPRRVLVDPAFLETLPDRELRSGLAEMLKAALLSGEELLARVERIEPAALRAGGTEACALVAACAKVKQDLVAQDPWDRGVRRLLNLGHTFGHAFEALAMPRLTHGEAVGLGLLCATRLAGAGSDLEQRLRATLRRWALPDRNEVPAADVEGALRHDKKRRGGRAVFVTISAPGSAALLEDPAPGAIRRALEAVGDPS